MAWLSLDAGDNDPARFWIYVIEALRSVLPGFGEAALAMLRAPGIALVDEALPELINELVDVPEQFVLVLDDYHAIDDERIHEGMASLLEHLPDTLRIVITSRVEPPLGIGTLRARGQLNEIDAAQLRFSRSEAESLLNDVHGLGLPAEMVGRLHERTEGWAAGLYLAVLSMRGREDVEHVHRVVHRQRPTGGRLSRRRGARRAARRRGGLPASHGPARQVLRASVRRRHRRPRQQGDARPDRALELLPDSPRSDA